MNIIIKTKNLELTSGWETFINEKVGKLEKFLQGVSVEVSLEKETVRHRKGEVFFVEIMAPLPEKNLVARAKGEDLEKIIIEAKDEMEIVMKKYKTKKIEEPRRKIKKELREIEGR